MIKSSRNEIMILVKVTIICKPLLKLDSHASINIIIQSISNHEEEAVPEQSPSMDHKQKGH